MSNLIHSHFFKILFTLDLDRDLDTGTLDTGSRALMIMSVLIASVIIMSDDVGST